MRTLIEAPTVAGLMSRMSLSSLRDALDVMLPIRVEGSQPPIFCLHPAGGLSWCYMPLAPYVRADYPLYGLQARGLDGSGDLAGSVASLAADYIEQIRAVRETGPYYLLGWSFGGIVAHEIAVQLSAAGEQVELVIMDTYPQDDQTKRRAPDSQEQDGREHNGQERSLAATVAMVRAEQSELFGEISDAELANLARIYQDSGKIMFAHALGRFDGNLLLIAATEGRAAGVSAKWRPCVSGDITEVRLPCKHSEMIRPDMLAGVWHGVATWLGLND